MSDLRTRLEEAVAGTALAERLPAGADALLSERGGDAAASELADGPLAGLARLLASELRTATYLSHRPGLFERIASARADTLEARTAALESELAEAPMDDLEGALDALRLLRRDETCLAACLDLGGVVPFEEVSRFLSILAEAISRRALDLARHAVTGSGDEVLSVVGMGKLAGREFTYHSDLDLVFLYRGGVAEIDAASRMAQRMISFLTTMTGAGVAYAVDTRLRPSGRQGALVTTYEGFERYQSEEAETWEHLALLRARAVAGDVARATEVLDRVRARLLDGHAPPWAYLAELRGRVEQERGTNASGEISLKTGAGGLMDVDFLAGGALLERGPRALPTLPSVAAMLRAAASGPRVDELLADYDLLRLVEARTRWCAGRPVEGLEDDAATRGAVAELVEPGLSAVALVERLGAAQRRIRAAYDAVVAAGSIAALETPPVGS